ncbi:hypothetical protein CMI37_25460 [Candidatus Pacearchaeota archaeon]|nr:hypothetical protein [Candidatus Pacearchaeota archaeon]
MVMSRIATSTLARDIANEGSCRVTGRRTYGGGVYELEVVHKATGIPFIVKSREDWLETVRASKLYEGWMAWRGRHDADNTGLSLAWKCDADGYVIPRRCMYKVEEHGITKWKRWSSNGTPECECWSFVGFAETESEALEWVKETT